MKGKKAEKQIEEIVTPEIELQAEQEIQTETSSNVSDMSDGFKRIVDCFKEDGGWIVVKLKKGAEPPKKIGKYRPNDFDNDLIAKQYGGGTYFYEARDDRGKIRARFQEEYAEPEQKQQSQNTMGMTEIAMIMKDITKEIANMKFEMSKPKIVDNSQQKDMILEMIKENQKNQIELLKAIAQPKNQNSMQEMMALFTTMFGLINKINLSQPQQNQNPQNTIKDVVELATLFADMKESGTAQPQTFMDTIKTFLTDGSLANVIAMLKAPQQPMIKSPVSPQQSLTQPLTQEQQQEQIVCDFFKQYEKQLFQLKVDGNTAIDIANNIIPIFNMNNDFKIIAYNFFKDIEKAFNSLSKVAVEFKNEQNFLREIIVSIHNYFHKSSDIDNSDPEETTNENLPQGVTINE